MQVAGTAHLRSGHSAQITRDKVAALARVSSATVSRVYNTPERVSVARCERVLKAARELGYIPNKSGSALHRTGTCQRSPVYCLRLQGVCLALWNEPHATSISHLQSSENLDIRTHWLPMGISGEAMSSV